MAASCIRPPPRWAAGSKLLLTEMIIRGIAPRRYVVGGIGMALRGIGLFYASMRLRARTWQARPCLRPQGPPAAFWHGVRSTELLKPLGITPYEYDNNTHGRPMDGLVVLPRSAACLSSPETCRRTVHLHRVWRHDDFVPLALYSIAVIVATGETKGPIGIHYIPDKLVRFYCNW